MADAGRHPNIKILANTEIEKVEGEAGNFTVTVLRKPRYVDEDICVGCRNCSTYCPYTVSNPFDENLGPAKAIDIWCPQAIPASAAINRDVCLYFDQKCTICKSVCQAKAIDFKQQKKRGIMHVGSIIVSPGYEIFDARKAGAYGYGRFKNVLNSLEFERMLNASGPFEGEVIRLSDGKTPKKIAWLQCIGSRDSGLGNTYCSGICCTYALKQMILVKNHHPDIEVSIFHNDIRTFGKGFEDFYNKAKDMEGSRFIRRRISSIKENKQNNNLSVSYTTDDEGVVEEEFDMVILSVGMSPSKDNEALAETLGIELNEHGFCKVNPFSPNEAEGRPGIYPAASFTAPIDIPDSISSASGSGAIAAGLLSSQRGALAQDKEYPDEKSVEGQSPRIGVFVCSCGTNIAGVADVEALAEFATTLDNVVHVERHMISCGSDSLRKITEAIKEKNLNRVVVAACTPRDHETVFREALKEAGLNPYLLDMANIREHCTWVHSMEKQQATEKAKDTIAMSVARVRNLTPLDELELPVDKRGLVLGGGLAGMNAALSVARQGFEVYLVEKEEELGGHLRHLYYNLEGQDVQAYLKKLTDDVENEKNITVYKGYELTELAGYIGNFTSTLVKNGSEESVPVELKHGITIVATGGESYKPTEYCYEDSTRVVTQQELEGMIASGTLPENVKQVAMIQCVGARNEEHGYCSRICCGEALKNTLKLKEINPDIDITVFYRDMRAYGFKEDFYLKAREEGALFIQYEPERKPEVTVNSTGLSVRYYDNTINMEGEISPDLLVLSTPVVPEANKELSKRLRLPLTVDGFFMEAHMKLRPLDFATDGIFLCGMAQYPKDIPETINQANGAALRAATILSKDTVVASGTICEVDEENCIGCSLCARNCPYNAIEMVETEEGKIAHVIPAACKGCGVCNAVCPTNAITLNHFKDDQIFSQIRAAYSVPVDDSRPKILSILCNWCGYAAADLAGVSRMQYPADTRVVRVLCTGRVHPKFIYESFLQGMDAVLVVGCHPADCHYISGVQQPIKSVPQTQKALEKLGIDGERLHLDFASAAEGAAYANLIKDFTAKIKNLGHLVLTDDQKQELQVLRDKKTQPKKKGKAGSVAGSDDTKNTSAE
ncbi:MAG: hydrogenase iron-sulfur subunit [Dehalococcoidales bacterium]|nr:hydrogenase iron-sulfur subunit [Dehalococcoidales bacterium]